MNKNQLDMNNYQQAKIQYLRRYRNIRGTYSMLRINCATVIIDNYLLLLSLISIGLAPYFTLADLSEEVEQKRVTATTDIPDFTGISSESLLPKPPGPNINTDEDPYDIQNARKELIDYSDNVIDSLDFKDKTGRPVTYKHHNNIELYGELHKLHHLYPNLTRLYSIGKSVEGRDLWVLELSDKPGQHEIMKPEFKYVANMHGNEVVGRELLLLLARLLLDNYRDVPSDFSEDPPPQQFVRKLLKATRIHLMPSINPDGYEKSSVGCVYELNSRRGRLNSNNIDLNRNFPDHVIGNQPDANTQPETRAIMEWSKSIPFVLSANLHGGALVVSYPFDGAKNISRPEDSNLTPDDELFKHLSRVYAFNHKTMFKSEMCYDFCGEYHKEIFTDGIVNGASWYSLYGSMQDWLYTNTNHFDLTIELGCNQYPPATDLEKYWLYNKRALLSYIKEIHKGIKGIVYDASNGLPLSNVKVKVQGIDHDVISGTEGDFWRLLLPGTYYVQFSLDGYKPETVHVFVTTYMASIIRVYLNPEASSGSGIQISNATNAMQKEFGRSDAKTDDSNTMIILVIFIVLVICVIIGLCFVKKRMHRKNQSLEMS